MKKLLSILVMVLFGVTTVCAEKAPAENSNSSKKDYGVVVGVQVAGEGVIGQGGRAGVWHEKLDANTVTNSSNGKWTNTEDVAYHYDYETSSRAFGIFNPKYYNYANQSYYYYAVPSTGYYFDSWTLTNTDLSYTTIQTNASTNGHDNEWEVKYRMFCVHSNDYYSYTTYPHAIPLMTANFKKQAIYRDYVQVQAIYRDISGNVKTDPNTGEPVLGGGVVSVGDAIDANSTSTDAAGTNTLIRGGKATNKFSYTYHAQADKNFVFKGWSESPTGIPLLSDVNTTITKEWETATNDENNPYVAPVLYAVFQQEFTYYYTGATAYVAGETEGGEIRVSYDGGANYTAFAPSIQDNGLKSQLNDPNLKIRYDAKVLDDSKYAFRGWSKSSAEGQSSMYPNPHDDEHTMEAENTLENNPYVPETWYAIFASYYYKNPPALVATNSKGSGKVSVSNTTATPSVWYDEMPAGELVQKPATGNAHTYTVTYHAKADDGARFVGWYSSADASVQVSQDNPYTRQYATSSMDKDNPMIEAPLYAAFRSDIDIRQQDRMIVYIDDEGNGNINDSKVLIDFQKANTLTATLSGTDASLFSLSNRSGSKSGSSITFDATQGLIELVVAYNGNLKDAVGKVANITLSATYGDKNITRPVTIVVEEAPIITFLPTDGKGAYTIKMTNGSGINYTMNADVQENIKVPVTHESMSNIEMNLTNDVTTDKYYFFGWQIIDGDVISYLSYDKLCTYQFTKPVKVRAEFIPNNAATFIIKGDETPYYDLKRALEDASIRFSRLGPQVVVFNNEYGKTGAAQKTGILAKPKNATEYVIPNGVTLLIPYSADFVARLEALTVDDYLETGNANGLNCYRKLILEDGTNIRVERGGNICVGAQMVINGLTVASLPYKFGHIELGNNCHIQFEEGSTLFAWGYITNPAGTNITNDNINTVGRVTIDKGATVHESFMYADWRGGNATADFIQLDGPVAGVAAAMGINTNGYRYQVFPMSQYYIQNVEAPMTIRRGATEILSTAVYTNNSKTRASLTFMAENAGLFRLKSDDVSVTKYYDPLTDRLKMYVHGSSVANSKATMGTMELNLGSLPLIGDLSCNSKDYVLPINNNMDVSVENVTITSPYNMAMMAGSTFNIASTAHFKNEAQFYVYDVDESKLTVNGKETGYCGVYNNPIVPLTKRLGSNLTFKRATLYNSYYYNPINLQDATIIIDGVFENSSTGYLLTTKGGARIISNGGGKVIISKEGKPSTGSGGSLTRNQTPFQYIQGESGQFVDVPMKRYLPALLNGDGTYVDANINTYTYYNDKWNIGDVTAGNTPSITENFAPEFEVGAISLPLTYVGATSKQTLTITPSNKSSIAADYWDNVTWTTTLEGENADQYVYPTGTLPKGVMPSDDVIFAPTSDGKKYATLTISATYSHKADETNATIAYNYVQTIHLIADASYLQPNKLAFADLSKLYEGQGAIDLFQSGTQNNKKPISITITPNPNVVEEERGAADANGTTDAATITPRKVGSIIIKATQDPDYDYDYNIAGTTITKTITITEPVVWNWGDLYFGTVNEHPVTILNGAISWTLVEKEDKKNIIDFKGSSPNYTATIADQIAGKYEVTFTYSDNKGVTKDFISTVYTNPRHLRVDVNNDTVYRAVTLSANMQVNYHSNRKAVGFSSTAQNISQWKMTFLGVPDKIYFIPEGDNTWQIEESSNGINWTTSMPWKYLTTNEHFEMSLLPSTSYLRVSYGAGDLDSAYLKELYITELAEVKADVKKLYMPIDGVNNAIKEVVLTYANTGLLSIRTTDPTNFQLKFSDSDATPTEVLSIPATTDENPFGIKGVDVVCKATVETSAELLVFNGSQLVLQIPIYAYLFPQELPIKLATDQPAGGDRYYFVTTHSHNAEWDGTDGVRTLTMNNAVSDAAPYVTFAFEGAPTFISFDYTSAAKGVWKIEESTDGKDFSNVTPATDDVMADGKFKRTVSNTSKYIKVIYESAYAEKVDLTDITIVGAASVVVDPTKMELDFDVAKKLTLTTVNLTAVNIATSSANFKIAPTTTNDYKQTIELDTQTNPDQLGENKMGNIVFDVKWTGNQMVEYGTIVITNPNDGNAVLATVELTGIKNSITDGDINIYTGVPSPEYTLKGTFEGSSHRKVDISAAFSADATPKPLFDYVVVYGETTTNDDNKTITTPNSTAGSNAKTPYYIYKKSGDGKSYVLDQLVENANSSTKAWSQNGDDAVTITSGNAVSMYITGFCPYATTGYTKDEEGVWYFRANAGQSIDVYLQDCYIYSRAKTIDGHTFATRSDGQSFVDHYSRGTGAVLVFACNDKVNTPMNVTIHTLDNNLLKSNYGCFLQSLVGRAFQVSSPIQIRLLDDTYATASTTTLNFTDEWPASQHAKTGEGVRTNGFLSLQKQVNNAPSIDMGNSNTVVNFNGGQVELQNAQIISTNYASSLAICPRSGKFAGIFLAYGLGADDVGGTVNFKDGTTTVLPMWVSPNYFESYLCEKDADGNYIKNAKGEYLTTCLRTPANTYVSGGSHCMMRACSEPQRQGGAPKDKAGNDGKLLGLYKFPKNPETGKKGGWTTNGTNGLVTPTAGNVPNGYKVESVTPNNNGTDNAEDDYLNFWFDPNFEPSAQPEKDKKISFWKTSMTRISAEYANYGERFVGGETSVEFDGTEQMEIVKNLLYCKIDENIRNVIIRDDFMAPVKNPAPEGDGFIPIHPTKIGSALNSEDAELENFITNGEQYQVENKVYYITTATADIWNAFTAPFDVANVYVMETYPEELLEEMEWKERKSRGEILEFQAEQNAYFAGFFGVTIALGQDKNFDRIYQEYMQWANAQGYEYPVGGMRTLIPYNGTNWDKADFYLNENTADWTIDNLDDGNFTTAWQFPDATDGILMHQGKTYAMLFPFCTGCGESIDDREYWDYWSGKFIIFESVDGTLEKPHKIYGSSQVGSLVSGLSSVDEGVAKLLGNSSFAEVTLSSPSPYPVLYYSGDLKHSTFYAITDDTPGVKPTESFLVANSVEPIGMQLVAISMDGKATYVGDPNNGTTTGSHTPTIGGGNSLFVTGIAGGINIAVAQPQFVQVISATGVVLYNGYVTDNINVPLPINGIYVIKGENEAQKIFF